MCAVCSGKISQLCLKSLIHVREALPDSLQDFSIGFVLVPIVCGLTLGELGGTEHGENFFYQLQHSSVSLTPLHLLPIRSCP